LVFLRGQHDIDIETVAIEEAPIPVLIFGAKRDAEGIFEGATPDRWSIRAIPASELLPHVRLASL